MQVRHYILATAGHVDHGKSALVKALTGTDPDRLPEEKARGITIDLGFAQLDLPAPPSTPAADGAPAGTRPTAFSVGIVDVPGHEDFVKNMVAGVGSIDLALFIVAADDGWMPQSEEHLQILGYLGVTRAVVALTKADLVAGREAEPIAAVRQALALSPFAAAPIVTTSVITGRGLDELKTVLAGVLAETPPPRDLGKPRLPVDRVFTLKGIGTVVTGTLSGGTLQLGQAVVLQPAGRVTRVRSLQNHHADVEFSPPGTRTAVNLPDVEPHSETQPQGVDRGHVLTVTELGEATVTADVMLEKSARLAGCPIPAARPLKDRTRVRVHHGSANVPAAVFVHGGGELPPGGRVWAQLRFETPVFLLAGDRFIVRDWSEQATLAGGLVLDADGDRKHWQIKPQQALLEARGAAPDDPAVWVLTALARDGAVRRDDLLRRTRFRAEETAAALAALAAEKRIVLGPELAADPAAWQAWLARAASAVDAAHRVHPEWVGLPLAELRTALAAETSVPGAFEALVSELDRSGFVVTGTAIRRAAHRPALPSRLQAAGDWLRQTLQAKPLEPPSRKELTSDRASQEALKFLIATGEAVEVGSDQVLSAEAYARAVDAIRAHLRRHGQATMSDLRQVVGTTRRIIVPLCERLDREGITRREGDWRRLGR